MSVCKQCGGEIEYAGNPDYCYKCIMSAEIVDPPRCQSIESNYADQIAQLTKERDQLAAEVARLNECCRKEFSDAQKWSDECQKLAAKCAEMRESLVPFQCETCNGTHLFTFECPSCLSGEGECTCDKQTPEPCPQCQSENGCKKIYENLEHALSDQCGEGWLSAEKAKVLVEALNGLLPFAQSYGTHQLRNPNDLLDLRLDEAKQALEACKI